MKKTTSELPKYLTHRIVSTAKQREAKAMQNFYKLLELDDESLDLILNGEHSESIFDNNDIRPLSKRMTYHDAFHIVKHLLRTELAKSRRAHSIEIETADIILETTFSELN